MEMDMNLTGLILAILGLSLLAYLTGFSDGQCGSIGCGAWNP